MLSQVFVYGDWMVRMAGTIEGPLFRLGDEALASDSVSATSPTPALASKEASSVQLKSSIPQGSARRRSSSLRPASTRWCSEAGGAGNEYPQVVEPPLQPCSRRPSCCPTAFLASRLISGPTRAHREACTVVMTGHDAGLDLIHFSAVATARSARQRSPPSACLRAKASFRRPKD